MDAAHVETFRSSLVGAATLHETTATETAETLDALVSGLTIGTPLPFEDATLPDGVETDFTPADIEAAETGITPARHAIADYGTVTIPADEAGRELVALYPSTHIIVLAASDIAPDMATAYDRLDWDITAESGERVTTQVLATGSSATADMGTLIQGVHGPSDVHIVLLEDC